MTTISAPAPSAFTEFGSGVGEPGGCATDVEDRVQTVALRAKAALRLDPTGKLERRVKVPTSHEVVTRFQADPDGAALPVLKLQAR